MILNPELFMRAGALLQISQNRWAIGWGQPEWRSEPSSTTPSFYLPDFFLKAQQPWLVFPQFAEINFYQWQMWCRQLDEWAEKPQWQWRGPEKDNFSQGFEQLKALMASGELEKAVPVHFERSDERVSPSHLAYLIRQTTQAPENLRAYGFWWEGEGMLGLTPEELFEIEDSGRISTVALAGTRPRFEAARKPLLEDPKERREHSIVLEDLKKRMSLWGKVWVEDTELLQLPHLEHLRARLEVEPQVPLDFSQIVTELHPTPALGAAPREKGIEFLEKLNQLEKRYRFGAPFGVRFAEGKGLCLVAIRNLQWNSEGIFLGAGCGIVAQSELEREWKELELKRSGVKKFLDL